jgi:subtilisin family serine protease
VTSSYLSIHRRLNLAAIIALMFLCASSSLILAQQDSFEISIQTDLPRMRSFRAGLSMTWDDLTARLDATDLFGRVPNLAISTSAHLGDAVLGLSLIDLLSEPILGTDFSVRISGVQVSFDSSFGWSLQGLDPINHGLRIATGMDNPLQLVGSARMSDSLLSEASFRIEAQTKVVDFAYQTQWLPEDETRSSYTVDIPSIALGVTRTVYASKRGTWADHSWHPVLQSVPEGVLASIQPIVLPASALQPGHLAQLIPINCTACGVADSRADSNNTIGFGETMVGDVVNSGIILNCPRNVFCWLAEVSSSPHSPFSVITAPIGMTIPYGQERRLELGFAPTASGEFTDSITIRYCVAYWVEHEEDGPIAIDLDHVTGYYTSRCGFYTFPMEGTALAKPEARATYTPEKPICGKDVRFDGTTSYDPNPEGAIVSYHWEFGDGTTSAAAQPIHQFSRADTYQVSLTVTNNREMVSDPYQFQLDISPDLLETAATVGAAAAAGWATHALSMAAPVLAAAVPGAALAVSSIIGGMGLAQFPLDQLVLRFPESWDGQDVEGLITRNIPGASVIGFFSTLQAFLIQFPLSSESPEVAAMEMNAIRDILDRILPPGAQLGKNYIGQFEGSEQRFLTTQCDVDALDEDFRLAYEAVRAPEAWRRIMSSNIRLTPVRVSVIDSGIEASHSEFVIPLRGKSYIADENGDHPWYDDSSGHGTQVSGIIGAENGRGRMNGMLSGASGPYEMQVYRVIGDLFSVWDGLRIAVSRSEEELEAWTTAVATGTRRKCVVINISVGWDLEDFPDSERVLARNVFRDLFEAYPETLFVTSAGNGDQPNDMPNSIGKQMGPGSMLHAPGGLIADNNLTVAATDAAGAKLMEWSNYGASIDLAAPGEKIYTTDHDGGYIWRVEGTSYAAAMVSGAAAAIRSIDPALSPSEIKELLTSSPTRVRAPDGSLVPVLDFADAVSKAIQCREERNRRTLFWAAGAGLGALAVGLLVLRPF